MLNTRFITHGVDFNTNSTQYLLAKNITDFYTLQGEDILIVAYPPLSESSIPSALLHDANANILIASANHGWKTFDKQLCDQLMVQLGTTDVPFRICLTNAGRGAVEDFTQDGGQKIMESYLKSYKDIDVVVCQNDNEAFGAIDALKAAGKTYGKDGDIIIISFDATNAGLTDVKDGSINADFEIGRAHV